MYEDASLPALMFAVGGRAKIRSTRYTELLHFKPTRPGNTVTVRLHVYRDGRLAGYRVDLDPADSGFDPQDERLLDWPYSINELEEP